MANAQSTIRLQFSLAQLGLAVTVVAMFCGVLVSSTPLVVKAPLLLTAMLAASVFVWMIGRSISKASSLWVSACGELVMSVACAAGMLLLIYECVAVSFLLAYVTSAAGL